MEAVADPGPRGPADDGAARGRGAAAGVINLVTGDGLNVSKVVLADPDLAGIHFTGSTPTFQSLWSQVGANIASYRTYPRLVGETGGKDFVLAHPSADPDVLRTALVRGAFEYQGQKCSAASRAYVPASLWKQIKGDLASITDGLPMGDVTDFSNFMGAVIDERSFTKNVAAIDRARATSGVQVVAGGTYDRSEAGSCARRCSRSTTPRTRCSGPSTSARSSPSTSSPTAGTTPCSTRWSRWRRTA